MLKSSCALVAALTIAGALTSSAATAGDVPTTNTMSLNALTANALTANALTANAVAPNRVSPSGTTLDFGNLPARVVVGDIDAEAPATEGKEVRHRPTSRAGTNGASLSGLDTRR